jgi:hypothetical protein
MRNIKHIQILVLLLLPLYLLAQNNEFNCISNFDTNPDPQEMYSYATSFNKTLSTNPPMVLNIKFWDLRENNGSSNTLVNESDALETIAKLNIAYNEYNIYFKYRGFDHVDDDTIYPMNDLGDMKDRLIELGFQTQSSLNVILSDITDFGTGFNPGIYCQVPKAHFTEWVTIHEVGHNLGLGHPSNKYNLSACEQVSRDPNDVCDPQHPEIPCFNATDHGDKVVDTAAISPTTPANGYDYNICDYTFDDTDCKGVFFDLRPVDLLNYMNYNAPNGIYTCRTMFSTGQGVRMRETILGNPDIFVPISATVPDLYEPYAGEYYNIGPILPIHNPLFQPGFDYYFVECCCDYPQPSIYNDVSFSFNNNNYVQIDKYDLSPITHPNHRAIIINQLADIHNGQARKCYDNWNRKPGSGTITKFNDNVLNNNITVTPQDSLSINNQNLIQNLENGLYKIEKDYDDGSTQQTVIYKGNN